MYACMHVCVASHSSMHACMYAYIHACMNSRVYVWHDKHVDFCMHTDERISLCM